MNPQELSALIVRECRALGFHRVGLVPIEPPRRYREYREWLARDYHGEMAYMASPSHTETRADLRALLGEAKTLVVVALAYAKNGPVEHAGGPPRGIVARYARGEDYHQVFKTRLYALAERISDALGRPIAARPCVDSAPVLERELAERAELGFVAKNTMLIVPGLGSYVLLGELLIDEVAEPTATAPLPARCGACTACLDACPTGAFADPFVLDARRCISYLTIEHKGAIPRELRPAIGRMIFGCDICQEVCPFNARAPDRSTPDPALAAREPGLPDLITLLEQSENQRRRQIAGTPLRRVSRARFLRNVCVALGNAGDPAAIPALERALADHNPLVRQHAAWALHQLGVRAPLEVLLESETDAGVRAELAALLE